MTFIGQIELTKKKPPKVNGDERAWQDLYDTLNHLIDAVNSKKTTELRRPGNLQGSIGDLKVFKDKTDGKYYLEAMTEDGSARRALAITDKDVRTGKGYYSTSGIVGEGGTGGSEDSRNIEQQLFEAIPWTSGTPNNVAIDSDGKIVIDDTVGAVVSNDNIAEANLVGSGKSFVTKPPVTFRQDAVPTSLTTGDLWYDTNDGNKLYIALSVGADAVTGGEWVATVDGTIATAQSTASTAETNAQTGITNAASAQSTANSALSTANGKNISFYQDAVPTSVASGDMWFDTNDEYKMYRANAASVDTVVESGNGWYIVNAVPTLNAIAINASQITAGTIVADRINTASIASANINADNINAGTMTSGAINIGSGKAQIEADGDALFSSGAIKFDSNGNVHFQGDASAGGVIYFHAGNDTKNYSDSAFRLHHNESGNVLTINYDGSNKFLLENDGDLQVAGGFRFGDIGNNDIGFDQNGGNSISVQMNVNGSSMMPAVHASGSPGSNTVGYDLGKSTQEWRKVFAVDGNFGDLIIDNKVNARWILREQPDCILARNCKTQKTFKLNMTETSDYNDELWEDEQTT